MKNGWLKLLDFGQAKDGLASRISYQTRNIGTIYYNAPEQFDPQGNEIGNANSKADYWSLGILIYQLTCLKLPFTDTNERTLEKKIKTGEYEEIDESQDLRTLIRNLLKVTPDERITYSEIK